MRSSKIAVAGALLAIFALVDKTLTFTDVGRVKLRARISEEEVLNAQQAWGQAMVDISAAYEHTGWNAAKALAEEIIDKIYGHKYGPVLFKPTMAVAPKTFRTTFEGAVSYFVGGNDAFPTDHGFAIKGWRKVEFANAAIFRVGDIAVTVGNVHLTDKTGAITTVDKTFVFYKGRDRKLRIISHHSSLPFKG